MNYRIPKAKKLPSDKWNINMMIGGERISITRLSEKECSKEAMRLKVKYEEGLYKGVALNIPVGTVIDKYIESRSNVLSPSTIAGYKEIRRNRFSDIMDKKINNIKNWQSVINAESKLCGAKTLKNAWGLLRSALRDYGVHVDDVRLPQVVKPERQFLQPEQIPIMVKACRDSAVEIQVLLGLHGLRRSEIYAVHKKDVDNGIINVRGAKVRSEDGYVLKKTNKTAQSKRKVPVLIPRLNELVSQSPNGMLCRTDPTMDYKRINKLCEQNGLPLVGFHGLRHSFASLCYHLKLSELEAMRLGGWTDYNTMRKIYTHLAESDKTEATDKLKEFFANP